MIAEIAVVPGYYLVCYNHTVEPKNDFVAVVPGYYLVCYNAIAIDGEPLQAVVPGYYLVCYNYTQALLLYLLL